jgi:CIC family chloride channel protein
MITKNSLNWILYSIIIGLISGFSVILFYTAIEWCTNFFLSYLIGYTPPNLVGEGKEQLNPFWQSPHPWMLPIIIFFGGLLSSIINYSLTHETKVQGTDAIIDAYHQNKEIHPKTPFAKLITSAITIGSGGSAGKEGPIAQICGGIASFISARVLRLNKKDHKIALIIGMGSGIGSIFHAPIGGAIIATEFLYKRDIEYKALIPTFIASITSYSICWWIGWGPLFHVSFVSFSSLEYIACILIGICCGGMGLLYIYSFFFLKKNFDRFPLPFWIKPGLGGFLVGLLALLFPQIIGTSDGWLQKAIDFVPHSIPLWLICLLPIAKILATSLTVGSGGSGGIFGPGIVIGGFSGLAIWAVLNKLLPNHFESPATFVIVGMVALIGGIVHAPIGAILLGMEMTNSFSILIPCSIATCISLFIVGDQTIYRKQKKNMEHRPSQVINNGWSNKKENRTNRGVG